MVPTEPVGGFGSLLIPPLPRWGEWDEEEDFLEDEGHDEGFEEDEEQDFWEGEDFGEDEDEDEEWFMD